MWPLDPKPGVGERSGVGRALEALIAARLPEFLPAQRWFGAKGRRIASAALVDWAALGTDGAGPWLTLVRVGFESGSPEVYAVPLAVAPEDPPPPHPLGRLDAAAGGGLVADALDDPAFCLELLAGLAANRSLPSERGVVRFARTGALPLSLPPEIAAPKRLTGEQSNTSVIFGRALILKAFRKIEPGLNPDAEITGFLTTRTRFRNVALLGGTIEYAGAGGVQATLAQLQQFVPSQGDGWRYTLSHLGALYEFVGRHREAADRGARTRLLREFAAGHFIALRRLGALTGGLHAALAGSAGEADFDPEPISRADTERWSADIAALARLALADLGAALPALAPPLRAQGEALLARESRLVGQTADLAMLIEAGCRKCRIHGDYHLGQTLRTEDDFILLDFEGEPARSLVERRARHSPLKDVAGMLRSLDYAAAAGLRERPDADGLAPWAEAWTEAAAEAFLDGYLEEAATSPVPLVPAGRRAVRAALGAFELEKALYELRYEINNRPGWIGIPLGALARLAGPRPRPAGRRGGAGRP